MTDYLQIQINELKALYSQAIDRCDNYGRQIAQLKETIEQLTEDVKILKEGGNL